MQEVSRATSQADFMLKAAGEKSYFAAGEKALSFVKDAIRERDTIESPPIKRIHDFGCGFGRVTRWLRAAFPDAEIAATDRNPNAAKWCAENLGTLTKAEAQFDLVFLGSVITHLPATAIAALLGEMVRSLSPAGLLMFSAQGEKTAKALETIADGGAFRNVGTRETRLAAVRSYKKTGFGFVSMSPDMPDYGTSLSSRTWIHNLMSSYANMRHIMTREAEWGGVAAQDIYAFSAVPVEALFDDWVSRS